MTCGLAEEETRLVSSGAGATNHSPRARSCVMDFFLTFDCFVLVKPRTSYRPQTVCGRCCPWEPTALRVAASHDCCI